MSKRIEKYKRKWHILPWLVCGTTILVQGNITRFQYALCLGCMLYYMWNNESLDKFSNFGNDARKERRRGKEKLDEDARR